MVKSKFLFKIYYIGKKKYFGSQKQREFLTIEHCFSDALEEKNYINDSKNSQFEFASRTDRFVSARGACFTCIIEKEAILMEINSILPEEMGIWAYSKVPLDFSSRYNAKLRHYLYIVPTPLSYLKKKAMINLTIMEKACRKLQGQHDFVNFSKNEKKDVNTIRDMDYVNLSVVNDYLVFNFKSKAFLRQQVRRMVKKLLELGRNEISYNKFIDLFDNSKIVSYQPADPKGLILWNIVFDDNIKFIEDPKSKERMYKFFQKEELNFGHKHQLFRTLQQDYSS
ncbi:MAG: tRNA pseudouridine synthase A [Promethearchaeota archaeon]